MSSGPSHVLVISNPEGTDDVISAWQAFLGPAGIEEAKREHPERYTLNKSYHIDYEKVIIKYSSLSQPAVIYTTN